MYHNKFGKALLPLIVLIFAIWETIASKWIIIVAAVLMLIHVFGCSNCCSAKDVKSKPKKRKK